MVLSRSAKLALIAVVVAGVAAAKASPIPGLFPSGVDGAGVFLSGGAADPHYGADGHSAYVLSPSNIWGSWPTSTTGQWINFADSTNTVGTHVFSTTFDLTGLDPASAAISGIWTSDNAGVMLLNGINTGNNLGPNDFTSLHPFSITSGFLPGLNTITVSVDMDTWDGLIISEIQGSANALPEPASLSLLALGGLAVLRRRNIMKKVFFTKSLSVCAVVAGLGLAMDVGAAQASVLYTAHNSSNGHTYEVISQNNWYAAESEAVSLGGYLTTIRSAAENTWLVNNLLQDLTGAGGPNLTAAPVWTGLYDPTQEPYSQIAQHASNFVWADGEPVTYTNWNPGEPNNFNGGSWQEYYTTINWNWTFGDGSVGTWNDAGVNGTDLGGGTGGLYYGIVETVPEPASLSLLVLGGLALLRRKNGKRRFEAAALVATEEDIA